jgi:hypothetical protein
MNNMCVNVEEERIDDDDEDLHMQGRSLRSKKVGTKLL